MNQDYDVLSIGFKLGQGVSSLSRIYVSLSLYKKNNEDEIINRILIEVEDLIKKLTI